MMLGAALVAVLLVELVQLLDDQGVDALGVAEDRAQLADQLHQLGVLGADLVRLERGQALDRRMSRIACAWISESSNFSIRPARAMSGVVRGADQRDHRVEVVERDQQALEDVGACLGRRSSNCVLRDHHLALVADVVDGSAPSARASSGRRRPARPC